MLANTRPPTLSYDSVAAGLGLAASDAQPRPPYESGKQSHQPLKAYIGPIPHLNVLSFHQ